MKKLFVALALPLALAVPSPALAAPHSGPNWTWDGPASWDASYGTYGITVTGEKGATLDLGFSSTTCAAGATWAKSVDAYFKALRKQLAKSGWHLSAGKVKHPSGFPRTYRRQELTGTHKSTQGEITLDYDFTTNVDGINYCYQRSLAEYADQSSWKAARRTLIKVQNSLAYSGPGAPEGEDPGEF